MKIPAKYFHDRIVLLLITLNVFITGLMSVLILYRLDGGSSDNFIVQYRSNLGLGGYEAGGVFEFIAFIIFALIILLSHIVLSMRIYDEKRQYSLAVLSLSLILVVFSLVVSNALLAIR